MARFIDNPEAHIKCRFKVMKICKFAGTSCNRITSKTCDVAKSFYDLEKKKCPVMVFKGYKKCGCDYLYIRLFAKQDGVDCAKGGKCIISSFDDETRKILNGLMDCAALGKIQGYIKKISEQQACA